MPEDPNSITNLNNQATPPIDDNKEQSVSTPKREIVEDLSLLDIAKRKEEEIKKKEKKFKKIMLIIKIVFLVVGLSLLAFVIYLKTLPAVPLPPVRIDNPPEELPKPDPTIEWTQYKDEGLKIFVKYPPESKLITYNTPSNKLEIVYDSSVEDLSGVTEDNLNQGYIFRVTPLNIGIRTIERITEIKRDSFKTRCPTAALFTNISKTLVDTVDARTFDIKNCNSDYKVYYTPRFGIYYEIAQIFKGDFGVRQQYKSTTDEIFLSFKFFPEGGILPEEPFKTYINERDKFLFIYPNLDDTCCDIQAPPVIGIVKEVVLANKDTYVDINQMDGIGVFTYNLQKNFDAFLYDQKQLMIEEYKVVNGYAPEIEDLPFKLGKIDAQLLKGYSWRGTNFIYAQIPKKNIAIIFSIKSTNKEFEDKILNESLSTFETF
jgi:hypothetical protein